MPSRHASVPSARVARHASKRRTHHVRHTLALTLVGVLAFAGAGIATAVARFQGNVDVADALSLAGAAPKPSSSAEAPPADPAAGKALNLLVLGSDQRDGVNGEIGGDVKGMRSDTTLVVHISADRTRAEVVSIPRDSLVKVPSCTMSDGSTSRARTDMFNSAFATGWDQGGDMTSAAGCTIKTVQSLTGLTIDHFIVVDFAGFQQMIDAIGGVPICIPKDYNSPDAGLHVNAGYQTLNGETALAYARARKGKNMNGSDLERAGRQQQLVAAMVREVLSKNVLTNVPQLLGFLDAATSSLTVDPGLGHLTDMAGLAMSLRGMSTGGITFMTIPVATAPTDKNRVVWTSAATKVWANMVADQPIVATEAAATPTATPGATAPAASTPPAGATTPPATTPPVSPATTAPPLTDYKPGDPFTAEDTTAVCG